MRKLGYLMIVALALMVASAPAQRAEAAPGDGIKGSYHDFTAGAPEAGTTDSGAGICIFCHIQHRTRTTNAATFDTYKTRLLWNHRLSSLTYSWSDVTQTVNGTPLPTNLNSWAGSSKNCLSCHDGTVAVGDVYRTAAYPATSFTVTGTRITDGKISASFLLIGSPTGDLKGNHPVGIPYPFNGVASNYNGITTGAGIDFDEYMPDPVNVKLFTDVGGDVINGATAGATGIECASCHDVHNKDVIEDPLLRDGFTLASGAPSQICLNCHNK